MAKTSSVCGALVSLLLGAGCGRLGYQAAAVGADAASDGPPDAEPSSPADRVAFCDPTPRDFPVPSPLAVTHSGALVGVVYRPSPAALWFRRLDEASGAPAPVRLAGDFRQTLHMIPGVAPDRVFVSYEAVENGWNSVKLFDLDLRSGSALAVTAGKQDFHQGWSAIATEANQLLLAYEEEDFTGPGSAVYRMRIELRAPVGTIVSTGTVSPTFRPHFVVPTSAGYLVAQTVPNTNEVRIHAVSRRFVDGGVTVTFRGDVVAPVQGTNPPVVLRSAAGGLELIALRADGTPATPARVVKTPAGSAITRAQALQRTNGLYVFYVQDGVAQTLLVTDTGVEALDQVAGVTGGVWLVDTAGRLLRVAAQGDTLRVAAVCP